MYNPMGRCRGCIKIFTQSSCCDDDCDDCCGCDFICPTCQTPSGSSSESDKTVGEEGFCQGKESPWKKRPRFICSGTSGTAERSDSGNSDSEEGTESEEITSSLGKVTSSLGAGGVPNWCVWSGSEPGRA